MRRARRQRGRHAHQPRRPAALVVGGLAGLGVVVIAAFVVTRVGRAPRTTVDVVSRQPTVAPLAAGRHDLALAYIRQHDGPGAAHVRTLVWTGPMLRVYTDLPESAANSPAAVALCRTAAAYLSRQGQSPEVFVHARGHDGYQVLANKLYARDTCLLNGVP